VYFLASLQGMIANIELKISRFLIFHLFGISTAVALHFMGADINFVSFALCFTTVFPSLYVGYRILTEKRQELTFITWGFTIASILNALHGLDFAYCLDKPQYEILGFTLALFLIFALTNYATAAIVESITLESTEVRLRSQYAASMANSSRLATLGEMAGGVAHEINNPLAILMMLCKIIIKASKKEPVDIALIQSEADKMIKTVTRIGNIVTGLLTFSRDSSNDPKFKESLGEIVGRALDLCSARLKTAGISLEIEPIDPHISILCRKVEITQALLNVINNAQDALVESEEKSIWIKVNRAPGQIKLIVENTGPQIPDQIKDKIFEPFYTTKPIGKGVGLGLSTSRSILSANEGRLDFENKGNRVDWIFTFKEG